MRVLVTGATGFVGTRLLRSLDHPVILTRSPIVAGIEGPGGTAHRWTPMGAAPPPEACAGVGAVVHLAGEPVAEGRWSPEKKARIRDSRVTGTRNIVRMIERAPERPRVLVCASAVGYYGDRGDEVLDEASPPGADFLSEVCRAWEEAAGEARVLGVRVVPLRIGIVLGPGGGALSKMLPPFRFGVGGRLAGGRQWMPWVHIDDVVGLILHAIGNEGVSGPVNAVAPSPVTNADFTKTLARVLRRPAIFPVPGFALKVALGEFAQVLLASQRVTPRAALASGYAFRHPALEGALREAVG